MASKHRDEKIIATIPCPICKAKVGEICRQSADVIIRNPGRPVLHTERRLNWQEQKRKAQPATGARTEREIRAQRKALETLLEQHEAGYREGWREAMREDARTAKTPEASMAIMAGDGERCKAFESAYYARLDRIKTAIRVIDWALGKGEIDVAKL